MGARPSLGAGDLFGIPAALGVAALRGLRGTPLGTLQWLLLAVTQVDAIEALCVGFFFVVAWRGRTPISRRGVTTCRRSCSWSGSWRSPRRCSTPGTRGCLQPDMQVMGAQSGNTLQWYVDDGAPELPAPVLISRSGCTGC